MKQINFNQWLDVFVEEKEINTERVFEFVNPDGLWNYMPLEVVRENMPFVNQAYCSFDCEIEKEENENTNEKI